MMQNKFLKYLDNELLSRLEKVDKIIQDYTKSDVKNIKIATNNLLNSGGKKIRSLLVLISFSLCDSGHNQEIASKTAAAVELIHNATLLHDDVIDDSNIRRGQQNTRSICGNKISVLAGDFILSIAFNLIVQSNNVNAIRVLSETAYKLAEGEIKQLDFTEKIITQGQYFQIIKTKTAILFSAACELAAILTDKKEYIIPLKDFGYNIGIAFQIIDDILDYTGDKETGKKIGNDFYNSKFTLPCIVAYEQNNSPQEKYFWEKTFFTENKNLDDVLNLLKKTNAIEITKNIAEKYIKLAEENLSLIPDSNNYKNILKKITGFILNRQF